MLLSSGVWIHDDEKETLIALLLEWFGRHFPRVVGDFSTNKGGNPRPQLSIIAPWNMQLMYAQSHRRYRWTAAPSFASAAGMQSLIIGGQVYQLAGWLAYPKASPSPQRDFSMHAAMRMSEQMNEAAICYLIISDTRAHTSIKNAHMHKYRPWHTG